jgi:hypothetical protein
MSDTPRSTGRLEVVMRELFAKFSSDELARLKTFDLTWDTDSLSNELLPVVSVTFFSPSGIE